jgi:hypothetical protein
MVMGSGELTGTFLTPVELGFCAAMDPATRKARMAGTRRNFMIEITGMRSRLN